GGSGVTGWIEGLRALGNEPAMLVTVMKVRGSAPRECGAKMLVTASDITGTIGGGRLEHDCTRLACDVLGSGGDSNISGFSMKFRLAAGTQQCCGGVAEILFERV